MDSGTNSWNVREARPSETQRAVPHFLKHVVECNHRNIAATFADMHRCQAHAQYTTPNPFFGCCMPVRTLLFAVPLLAQTTPLQQLLDIVLPPPAGSGSRRKHLSPREKQPGVRRWG